MGVAGNTTDLKLGDLAGKRAKAARGTLVQWNERRAVLQGQQDALTNELAQLDAMGRADLGCGLIAHVDGAGSLRINAGGLTPPEATLALRDHLCNVLGLPDRFQDVSTLTDEQARKLAVDLVAPLMRHDHEMVSAAGARRAIFSALDHVGVIQSETPLTTRGPGNPASQQGSPAAEQVAKLDESSRPAGTAGSAHNPNAASEEWDALHGVNVDGNTKAAASSLHPNAELARAIDAMVTMADQFTALIYRITKHSESVAGKRVDVSA